MDEYYSILTEKKDDVDSFEKRKPQTLHPYLYKKILGTVQIKEAGFIDVVNI